MAAQLIDIERPPTAPQTAPCAECRVPVPVGATYCSARCRNAADCHDYYDGWDGDL